MRQGFVTEIPNIDGGKPFRVFRGDGPTTSTIDLGKPPVGVNHTTESTYIPSFTRGVPHICIGKPGPGRRSRIVQYIGFGRYGTALQNDPGGVETNTWVRVQIEICGYSSLDRWLPADKRMRAQLASFYEWAERELGIPQRRPYKDALKSGVIWATEGNPRRTRNRKFGSEPGWYGHVEIPENDHWDPGSLKARVLLREEPEPPTVVRYQLRAVWTREDTGHHESRGLTPNVTLRRVGRLIATDSELREAIKRHQKRGHRIKIARRRIEK